MPDVERRPVITPWSVGANVYLLLAGFPGDYWRHWQPSPSPPDEPDRFQVSPLLNQSCRVATVVDVESTAWDLQPNQVHLTSVALHLARARSRAHRRLRGRRPTLDWRALRVKEVAA